MGNVNSTSTTRTPIPQSTQTSSQSDPSQDPAAQSQSAGTTQSPDAAPQSQAGTATGAATADAVGSGKAHRGLFGAIADVFIGGGQAIGDMVKGIATVITHPIQTVKGLGYVVTHPAALVHAFVDPYKQAIAEGRPGLAIGRGIVEIGSLFVGPGEIGGAFKGAQGVLKGGQAAGDVAKAGTLGAKGADLAAALTNQASAAAAKAAALQAAGHVGEAAKLNQFARIMQKSAALAATGTDEGVARAARYATLAANAQHVNFVTQAGVKTTMTMVGLGDHANYLLTSAAKAGAAAGDVAGKTGQVAEWAAKLTTQANTLEAQAIIVGAQGGKNAARIAAHLNDYAKALRSASAAGSEADALKLADAAAKTRGLKTAITAANKATAGISDVGAAAADILKGGAAAGTTTAGAAVATGAADATAKAGVTLAPAYDLPVKMTKGAAQAAKDLGMSSSDSATLLANADELFKAQRAAGATQAVALDAAKGYMAEQLANNGVKASARQLDLLANTLKPSTKTVLSNSATVASQFERTNYITRPLTNGAKLVGQPIDKGIVAVNHAGQAVAESVSATTQKVSDAVTRIGDLQIREIPRAVGMAATYPFRVAINGVQHAGQVIKNGLVEIGDMPIRRAWEIPVDAVRRTVQGAAEFVGRLPNMTLGELVSAPFSGGMAGLVRPAVALGALGRLGSTKDMPADDKAIAQKYGLLDTPENIKAFKAELASYKDSAIGPDTQDPQAIKQLQTLLKNLGYDVPTDGTFDQNTALAVIDFKQKHGIHQSYQLADGTPAINEYVDQATAQAMVSEAKKKAGHVDTSKLPKVTAEQLSAKLDTLQKAFDAANAAKTDADKAKAKQALEAAAVDAIHDMAAYVAANPSAQNDVKNQMAEIGKAFKALGYSDAQIQALVKQAQDRLNQEMAAGPASTPTVTADQLNASLNALQKAMDALGNAKTDADKKKAQQALESAAVQAYHDLAAFGAANPSSKDEVTKQVNDINSALKGLGYQDADIQKLQKAAQDQLSQESAASQSSAPAVTADQLNASLDALQKAMDALGNAKTDADKKKAQQALESAAVQAYHDLAAFGAANPSSKDQVTKQVNDINSALKGLGYQDADIQKLQKAAQDQLSQESAASQSSSGVTSDQLNASLDALQKAMDALGAAKTDADKKKAQQALEAATVQAFHDLASFGAANPSAKSDVESQVNDIVSALKGLGYQDADIQKLQKAAQDQLSQESASTPAAGGKVLDVNGQQVSDSLDALQKAFDALKAAKTDDDKAAAKDAVSQAAHDAIVKLTAFGLKHPDAHTDVENQLNEITGALKQQGFSDDEIKTLVHDAQSWLLGTDPSGSVSAESQTPAAAAGGSTNRQSNARLASYEAHVNAISADLGKIQNAKDPKALAAAETDLLNQFRGAVSDFNGLVGSLPPEQAAKYRNQLQQLGGVLTQLGFKQADIANILKGAKSGSQSGQSTSASSQSTPAGQSAQSSNDPAAADAKTYTVQRDDSLSRIAQRELGDASRWREIYDLNRQAIGANPNLILPGQKIKLPAGPAVQGSQSADSAAAASVASQAGGAATAPKPQPTTPAPSQPQAGAPAAGGQKTGTAQGTISIDDPQIKAVVKEKGILDQPDNVRAFVAEVTGYRDQGAIGPDSTSPNTVKQLQILLERLGYQVTTNGSFDDATANAVIDFKLAHGLHQSYKMADGTYAVNEYVGRDTAQAMVGELKKKQAAGQAAA
jgi:LysM repeat protein